MRYFTSILFDRPGGGMSLNNPFHFSLLGIQAIYSSCAPNFSKLEKLTAFAQWALFLSAVTSIWSRQQSQISFAGLLYYVILVPSAHMTQANVYLLGSMFVPRFRMSISRQFTAALLCFTPSLVCLGFSSGLAFVRSTANWKSETQAYWNSCVHHHSMIKR